MAVQHVAEELKALKEACLCAKGTVIDFSYCCILNIRGFEAEIVVVTNTCILTNICNNLTIVYRSYRRTTNFTVEHTVHHHCFEVRCSSSYIIIAYDTTHMTSSGDIGITIAVDNT